MLNIVVVFCGFLIAVVLARIIIPRILIISLRKRLFDTPDARKVHKRPVSRLGGVSFFPVILFTGTFLIGICYMTRWVSLVDIARHWVQILFMCTGLTLLFIVGIADDLIGVRYRQKFLVQLIAASMFPLAGLYLANERDGAAVRSFGRDVTEGRSAGRSRKATVGDKRHRFAEPRTDDGGRGVEHLAHAGPSLRSFVANDDHVARTDRTRVDGGNRRLLVVEDPGGTFVAEHRVGNGTALHHAPFGGEVPLQDRNAALAPVGVLDRTDDLVIEHLAFAQDLTDRFARNRTAGFVQKPLLTEFVHDSGNPARTVEVFDVMAPGGCQVTEVRRTTGDRVRDRQIELEPAIVRKDRM